MAILELNPLYAIPIALLLYWATLRNLRLNNLVLLLGGFLLYAWGHALWGLVLFLLTVLNYFLVKRLISRAQTRRIALIVGLTANIIVWLFCRYTAGCEGWLLYSAGFPLGMSFYLLRNLSYLIDISSGKFKQPHSYLDYALFISFFPQIFSGPLERPDDFITQIRTPRMLTWNLISKALPLLLMGLFKKMALADNLGMLVDRIFRLNAPSRLMLGAGSLSFAFEVYADFSGYTDLSRGFASLLGFETSENFNQPYLALTPLDFWRRWHITLSNWQRDYLFYPLRRKLLRIARGNTWLADWGAPLLTMLASGFWHGSGWTCLAWGLYHGLLLAISQASGWTRADMTNRQQRGFSRAATFMLVIVGWSIFRAPSLDWLAQVWFASPWGLSGSQGVALLSVFSLVLLYAFPLGLHALVLRSGKARQVLEALFYVLALTTLVIFSASGVQDFVYTAF